MEDNMIVSLFWQRDEAAVEETERKYGGLCRRIAFNILSCREDTEECVSDAYMAVWNSIPPKRPSNFQAFLCRIVQNFSLNRIRSGLTQKRGGGETALALDELAECVAGPHRPERDLEAKELAGAVDHFLSTLPRDDRIMFMYRYWLMLSMDQIAARFGCKSSRVNSSLHRSRQKLKKYLIKEGLL